MQQITLAMGRALRRLGVKKSRTMNMSLLMGLIGTLGLTILLGSLIPAETGDDTAVPMWEIGSGDDKDVFRFEITETGRYAIAMTDGPPGVGIWAIWYADGTGDYVSRDAPLSQVFEDFQPGTHYLAVGTPYQSVGNTGDYTVFLAGIAE